MKEEKSQLVVKVSSLCHKIDTLTSQVRHYETNRIFGARFLKDEKEKDSRTRFYTGLPNHGSFLWLTEFCENILPSSNILSPGDVLLMLLVKLKLNLRFEDIAARFGMSKARVSQIFNECLPKLAQQVRFLVRWPEKGEILRTLPRVFSIISTLKHES